ncbi:MAG: dehydrogenase [Citricoccus sp.]|nr:dehydrogenase [Citricoccus sp. WCRC_4]
MVGEFRMPSLGADMERGTLVEWLVTPGDHVRRGDVMATVDTEKTVMDVESFEDGVIAELLAAPGETLTVGTPMARITPTPASVMAPPATAPVSTPVPEAEVEPEQTTPSPGARVPSATPPVRRLARGLGLDLTRITGTGKAGHVTRADVERAAAEQRTDAGAVRSVRVSPRARRLAGELGVDEANVAGTGPHGAVTGGDILRAAKGNEPTGAEGRPGAQNGPGPTPGPADPGQRATGLRRRIGTLMSRSKKTIPHYYLGTTIDLQAALTWMHAVNAQRPVSTRLVPAALLLKASALAARQVPELNGFYTEARFRPSPVVHLGVAVALREGGLVAPAIHAADTLTVDQMMERLRDVVTRARTGHLRRAEIADPTLTVTALGELGVDTVYGVIYPPQVALVGFGRVRERPWAQDGMLTVHQAVNATLSADHRVSDGLRGGRFLDLINDVLQRPEEL